MDRWRAPVIPIRIEAAPGEGIHLAGVPRADVEVILREEDAERVRLGRVCLKCFEPLPESFPENCFLCGYAVRDRQAEDFAKDFGGTRHVGPSTSIDDEIERMREDKARANHNKDSSIWVPPSAA